MSFEAAWGVGGAQYINHLRWPQELAYVQRVCPERLAVEGKGINQFSTAEQVQQNFPSALVFNDSVVRKPNF